MEKLPISLCIICRNSGEKLRTLIEKHRPFVKEVIVLDQGSTDDTREIAESLSDTCVNRRHKGFCEPDREYLFSLATQEFILNLDDDEELDQEAIESLPNLLKTNGDIFWFKRRNLVDGVDIYPILKEDPQPRLWRKGALKWGDKMHVYPEGASNAKIFFLNNHIIHTRTLAGLKKANFARNRVASEEVLNNQAKFVSMVETILHNKAQDDQVE